MPLSPQQFRELCRIFSHVKNEREAEALLIDMFTPQERESLFERWRILEELSKGITQREIAEKLKVSISKITRGSRVLQYGRGSFGRMNRKK